MNNIIIDPRIEQVRKIVESLVSKTLLENTCVLVNSDELIFTVDNTILYTVKLKDIIEPLPPICFYYSSIINLEPNQCINDLHVFYTIHNIYANYMKAIHNKVLANNDQLRGDPLFEELISMKAADGMKYYYMRGNDLNTTYKIPIFSGFPNLNKQDDIGITVFEDPIPNIQVVRMIIFKKKLNRDVIMYVRTLRI